MMIDLRERNPMKQLAACLFSCLAILFAMSVSISASAQSKADWRTTLGVFRVGIVTGDASVLAARRAEPFRVALQDALGLPVELFPVRQEARLIDALKASRIEYAILSTSAFAIAQKTCKCAEPLVSPQTPGGIRAIHSVLYAPAALSGSVESFAGKTIIIPGKRSFSGYQAPLHFFGERGYRLGSAQWPLLDAETATEAAKALLAGDGQALFGWKSEDVDGSSPASTSRETLAILRDLSGKESDAFAAIWQSPPLRFGPHVVRPNLHQDAKAILLRVLRNLKQQDRDAYDAIEPDFGGGFVPASIADYSDLVRVLPEQTVTPPKQDANETDQP